MSDATGLRRSARIRDRMAAIQQSTFSASEGGPSRPESGILKGPRHTSTPRVLDDTATELKKSEGTQNQKTKIVLKNTSNVNVRKEPKTVHLATVFEEETRVDIPDKPQNLKKKQVSAHDDGEKLRKGKGRSKKHPADDQENASLDPAKQNSSEDSCGPVGTPGRTPGPSFSLRIRLKPPHSKKPSKKSKSSAPQKDNAVDASVVGAEKSSRAGRKKATA